MICGTDTLGVGVNIPIRTVLFTKLCKYDGYDAPRSSRCGSSQQISGRAGRKGFDSIGHVWVQAPPHVIDNQRAEEKGASDTKKRKKVVKKKAPERGYAHWTEDTFTKLVNGQPEPLSSSFRINHQMVLTLLDRPGDGCRAVKDLLQTNHETPKRRRGHIRRTIAIYRSLVDAELLETLDEPDDEGRLVRVMLDLQDEFALHQPLSLWALEAIGQLDPEEPDHALSVLSILEAVLESPGVIIASQIDLAKRELLAELKSQGIEYEERMERLAEVEAPKPNKEWIYHSFDTFRVHHPWIGSDNVAPKSIVRDMWERVMTFREFVQHYGLKRSEGVVLRYLSDAYKALIQNVPEDDKTEDLLDITEWLGELIRHVDSSLLDEWDRLRDPDQADVGIRGDRIAAVGDLSDASADRVVELGGRTIVPGFIDIHSHADEGLGARGDEGSEGARRRAAPNLVSQGVTTVVVNQDGRSPWPIADQRARYESQGVGPNVALMIGHGTVRGLAMGDDFRRPATEAEVQRMRELVRQGMAEGAYGLSAGLEYVPGRWSETSEVIAIVEETGAADGVYIVHERSSGMTPMWFWPSADEPGPPTMIDTILEDIEVAETTGTTTVATHIKARGADFWGASRVMIQLIDRARARGVPIWADAYPYNTTGSDGGTVLIPGWFIDTLRRQERAPGSRPDYGAGLEAALGDLDLAERIRTDIDHEISRRGGAENLVVMEHPDPDLVGRTLAELAAMNATEHVEMAIRLQLDGDRSRPGGARVRGFSLSELDVGAFAGKEWLVTASDAGVALPGDRPVHARYYGTFPRKIRRYAMEQGALTVEDAVRSATTLPAQILGMRDRGAIREGMVADIAVLDLERLEDTATFFEPHSYANGVDYVLVNGRFVVDDGELTYALPGRIVTPADAPRNARVRSGG